NQPLRSYGGCRRVDWLVLIIGIGGMVLPVSQIMQIRSTCVPIADSIRGAGLIDIKIACGPGGPFKECDRLHFRHHAIHAEVTLRERADEFKLLCESKHGPGQTASPRCKGRISLLRRRTAK